MSKLKIPKPGDVVMCDNDEAIIYDGSHIGKVTRSGNVILFHVRGATPGHQYRKTMKDSDEAREFHWAMVGEKAPAEGGPVKPVSPKEVKREEKKDAKSNKKGTPKEGSEVGGSSKDEKSEGSEKSGPASPAVPVSDEPKSKSLAEQLNDKK